MNSSNPPVGNAEALHHQPLAASAGVRYCPSYSSPIADWIDLMETIEALSPRWPEPQIEVALDYRL